MMRLAARLLGILSAIPGLMGLIPAFQVQWPANAPDLIWENGYGYLLGVFPNNLLLTTLHLAIGVWGLAAARTADGARRFLRVTAPLYLLLAVMGRIPELQIVFGRMPLFGPDVWLHALLGGFAAAFGYLGPVEPDDQRARRSGPIASAAMLFGRPIHQALVPFPIAFLIGALGTDLAYWWATLPWYDGSDPFWANVSLWQIGAGLITGVLAALVGAIDFLALRPVRAARSGRIHLGLGLAALALATINLIRRYDDPIAAVLPWGIVLSAITAALVAAASWHGGELVYRHLLAASAQPERESSK